MNTTPSIQAKSYFALRLKHENDLTTLKSKQKVIKKFLIKNLKNCKGIYLKRIDAAIYLFNKYPTQTNININDIILDGLERSFSRHYIEHKEAIQTYVSGVNKLQKELDQFRKAKKKEINTFKKENDLDFVILNYHYNKLTNLQKTYTKYNSLSEFNDAIKKYNFVQDIVDEFFNIFVAETEIQREDDLEQRLLGVLNNNLYVESVSKVVDKDRSKSEQQRVDIYKILANVMQGELA